MMKTEQLESEIKQEITRMLDQDDSYKFIKEQTKCPCSCNSPLVGDELLNRIIDQATDMNDFYRLLKKESGAVILNPMAYKEK